MTLLVPTPADRLDAVASLVATTRDLMLAAGTTDVEPAHIDEAEALLRRAAELLGARRRPRVHRLVVDQAWATRARAGELPIHLAPLNPLGIPLTLKIDGTRATASMTPGPLHEGPPNLFHGGFSAAVLDHLLGVLISAQGIPAFTAHLELDYLAGIRLDEPVEFVGEVVSIEGRKVTARAWIEQDGTCAVEAHGLFIQPEGLELGATRA